MTCPFCKHQIGHEVSCKLDGATKGELSGFVYEMGRRIETLETIIFNMDTGQILSREDEKLIDDIVDRQS